MLYTSLAKLKAANACTARYTHLVKALGGLTAWGKNTPIPLTTIIEKNNLDDALWALFTIPGHERLSRLFSCACMEHAVLPILEELAPDDKGPREYLALVQLHIDGKATDEELKAAREARAAWEARAARAAREAREAWEAWAAKYNEVRTAEEKWQTQLLCQMLAEHKEGVSDGSGQH
jgi:hypothetical protein